jgi:hypothetical protein
LHELVGTLASSATNDLSAPDPVVDSPNEGRFLHAPRMRVGLV